MSLMDLKKKIEKASKGSHVSVLSESDIAQIDTWISTPSYRLNHILQNDLFKGIPEKSLVGVVGEYASFKSSVSALLASDAQNNGFQVIIIDTEGSWTKEFTSRWGIKAEDALYIYESMIDNVTNIIGQILDSDDEKFFIILDSLGGLETNKLFDEAVKGDIKSDQGQLQKKIKRMLKLLVSVIKKKKSIGIIAGHMYAGPAASMFAETEHIGGGKYFPLSLDILLSSKKKKKIDKDKNVIGTLITLTSLKNRYSPPGRTCEIDIDFTNGINKNHGIIDLALDAGLIEQKGAGWMTNTLTEEKVQGSEKAEVWIDDKLLEKLNEYIKKDDYSSKDIEVQKFLSET